MTKGFDCYAARRATGLHTSRPPAHSNLTIEPCGAVYKKIRVTLTHFPWGSSLFLLILKPACVLNIFLKFECLTIRTYRYHESDLFKCSNSRMLVSQHWDFTIPIKMQVIHILKWLSHYSIPLHKVWSILWDAEWCVLIYKFTFKQVCTHVCIKSTSLYNIQTVFPERYNKRIFTRT